MTDRRNDDFVSRALGSAPYVAPPVVIVSAALAWRFLGPGPGLLIAAGGAVVLIIVLLWWSVQSLTGEASLTLEEAVGLAAPSVEEEQKRSVLRALKDLEYERTVGKISEDDYVELSTRYRAEARRLLRVLDEGGTEARKQLEQQVKKRLEAEGLLVEEDDAAPARLARGGDTDSADDERATDSDSDPDTEDEPVDEPVEALSATATATADDVDVDGDDDVDGDGDIASEPKEPKKARRGEAVKAPTRGCGECSTRNELDADFCKKCGASLGPDDQALCRSCPARFDQELDACPVCGVAMEGA